ncbi:MAG TPA: hypothetical protein VHN39_12715, partial [Phenylobacterium sp.]|nr:hypothetical protein [Phenylobacterium sp.]
ASELEADKSVISRWLNGSVQPSAHNLSRLSALIATRVEGFRTLDWDRDLGGLAEIFGVDPDAIPAIRAARAPNGLPIAIWDHMLSMSAVRGKAYEGFFKSTRPHPMSPGRYVHEYGMIRGDEIGLLRLTMGSAETVVDGWMIPLHGQLYSIAADVRSGTLVFGIFNGLGASRVDVFDGLTLIPGFDKGRSPTATAMLCERIGDLTGDREADDRHFAELAAQNPLAPVGSVPDHIQAHLARDFGPSQVPLGGDWLLNMALSRSMTRGPEYDP